MIFDIYHNSKRRYDYFFFLFFRIKKNVKFVSVRRQKTIGDAKTLNKIKNIDGLSRAERIGGFLLTTDSGRGRYYIEKAAATIWGLTAKKMT